MFTYLLTGSFGEYFLFYGLTEFYISIMLSLEGIGSSCPRFFPLSSPGVLAWDSPPSVHDDISFQNWFSYSLFPLMAKGGYFRFRILANHLASFFFPVRRLLRTTICPVYPFFIHPVTECKHLLAFTLTHILYFLWQAGRSWPTLLFLFLAAC